MGGDFFDFIQAGSTRLLVLLLDIAGKRDEALHIAATIQDVFHGAADLFYADDVNEPVAVTTVLLEINRAIMEAAGGVRCAPAFLGCYNEVLGTCCYINAGHTPALLKQGGEITTLEAQWPAPRPVLARHARCANLRHGQQLRAGAGVARPGRSQGHKEEFGLERVKQALKDSARQRSRSALCRHVQESVREFLESQMKRRLLSTGSIPIDEYRSPRR